MPGNPGFGNLRCPIARNQRDPCSRRDGVPTDSSSGLGSFKSDREPGRLAACARFRLSPIRSRIPPRNGTASSSASLFRLPAGGSLQDGVFSQAVAWNKISVPSARYDRNTLDPTDSSRRREMNQGLVPHTQTGSARQQGVSFTPW